MILKWLLINHQEMKPMKKIQSLRAIFDTPMHRRGFLLGSLALPLTACGGGGGGGSDSTPAQTTARISLAETQGAHLSNSFIGLSYEKGRINSTFFNAQNIALINLFKQLGQGVLRIGGNSVDKSSWNGFDPTVTKLMPSHVDALAGFLEATGWTAIYGINMANNSASNAAQEASYAAQKLGSSLMSFEIGNEPDLYVKNKYRPQGWSYNNYLSEWKNLAAAINQAAPSIPLTGPAVADDIYGYAVPFALDTGSQINTLTSHYYRNDANSERPTPSVDVLLQPDPNFIRNIQALTQSAASLKNGFRLAEFNSFVNQGVSGVSDTYASALWVLDLMFTCALNHGVGVNLHGGQQEAFAAITDINGVVQQARPVFYGLKMFAQLAQGASRAVNLSLSDNGINFSAYGVMRLDNGQNILLINKDASRSVQTTIDFPPSINKISRWDLTGPSLSSTSGVLLNGFPINPDGSWAGASSAKQMNTNNGTLSLAIPPFTAILLQSN
ncbi:hypothetical protein [Chromobacterium amazonense]|uniref:hypothetical protein n=1 Tax=Chromobacterium amazonense TaxID=1382803 RepID=UPI0031F66F8B